MTLRIIANGAMAVFLAGLCIGAASSGNWLIAGGMLIGAGLMGYRTRTELVRRSVVNELRRRKEDS